VLPSVFYHSAGGAAKAGTRDGHDCCTPLVFKGYRVPQSSGGRIPPMCWTVAFYGAVVFIQLPIIWFIWSFWDKANNIGWRYTDDDSRDTYVDVAKTMITASGIAVALVASIALSSEHRPTNHLVALSAKVATVLLIGCVCVSLVCILALARGHEQARSRSIDKLHAEGHQGRIERNEGALNNFELRLILLSGGAALSCFFTGFLFLGRIVFHF